MVFALMMYSDLGWLALIFIKYFANSIGIGYKITAVGTHSSLFYRAQGFLTLLTLIFLLKLKISRKVCSVCSDHEA